MGFKLVSPQTLLECAQRAGVCVCVYMYITFYLFLFVVVFFKPSVLLNLELTDLARLLSQQSSCFCLRSTEIIGWNSHTCLLTLFLIACIIYLFILYVWSPFTTWVLGFKLRLSGLGQVPLPAELSCQLPKPHFQCLDYIDIIVLYKLDIREKMNRRKTSYLYVIW